MDGSDRATWFAGDLADPWVADIADALPRETLRFDCPGDLPEHWPTDRPTPSSLVVHRANLNANDAQRVLRMRSRPDRTPRVVLCVGPHARHADIEGWTRVSDVILPEATAREVVLRHALPTERRGRPRFESGRPRAAVISTNHEMRNLLSDAARAAGYNIEVAFDPIDATHAVTTAWDVPVLEPEWPERLAALARTRPVLALFGFADRRQVRQAHEAGAQACLDLPCDVDDFVMLLDRLSQVRTDPAHDLPPAPGGSRITARRASRP